MVYWRLGQPVAHNWNPNHALAGAIGIACTRASFDHVSPRTYVN